MSERTIRTMTANTLRPVPLLRSPRRSRVNGSQLSNGTAAPRTPKPWHVLAVVGLSGMFVLLATFSTWAADPPKKPMRATATVAADANVFKRLGMVEIYLNDKRWVEAVDILHEVAQSDGRSLVEAQPGQAGGSAAYLNVATRCQVLLSRMPKEGLAAYRRKVDPQAKRWFENWQRTRDASELERLVRQAFLSSYGDDALWALGEAAWDRQDYAAARLHWSQLIPLPEEARAANLPTVLRYPDSGFDAASVVARLVLCSLMEGHRERAIEQQQHFAEQYPQAEGSLAGRQGRLAELLTQILDESSAWDATPADAEVATFGLAPERTQILPSVIDVGAPRWQQPLTSGPLQKAELSPLLERFRSAPDRGPLSTHPVVFRDVVLVNDADSIFAFNLLTGEPAWPTERGTAQIYPPVPEDHSPVPDRMCVGVPWFTMTVSNGKLFARMGSPVTTASDTELRDLVSDIVCLDLNEGQGKLVWKFSSDDWRHDGERPWRFEGSPLVKDGLAYLVHSRRRPQMEFAISCLDAAGGERKWTRTIATARTSIEDHQNRVSHLLPTWGAGKLFVSTDAGAIVAVDARDGRVEWAVTYESDPPTDAADQSDHAKQGLVPAMFHEGLLFVAPNDSDRLFCIEADSGRVLWRKAHPRTSRWRHLLGVAPGGNRGRLIVSGSSLWALEVDTGREAWKIVAGDPTERGYGRGVLAGDVVIWPTREAIQIVGTATGQPRRNVPLNTPDSAETGGNVTIAGGMLLVAQSDKLVAYGEYSLLKERLHRKLSSHPDKAEFLFQLAEIEAASGNLEAATKALQIARQLKNDGQSAVEPWRREQLARLCDLMRRTARRMLAEGKAAEAIAGLAEVMLLATEPVDRAGILFDLADAELARRQPVSAVEHWQQILDDVRLRTCPRPQTTAGAEASAAIARLIAQQGRAVYAMVEPRATREIAVRQAERDLPGLHRVLKQYPHAEVATQTWLRLAARERDAGQFQTASSIHARLVDEAVSLPERAAATISWAGSLEAAGYWRTSHRVWSHLATAGLAELTIDYGGMPRTGDEIARERLSRPEYRPYEPIDSAKAGYLDRTWTLSLTNMGDAAHREATAATGTPPAKVFVPEGDPPSHSLACILIHRPSEPTGTGESMLECRDRETGTVRWRRAHSVAPRWVAYAETHLLVATEDQLSALTLEEGRSLWEVTLFREALVRIQTGVQLRARDHWVIAFDQQTGLSLIDSRTGEMAWSFLPRGRVQSKWSCGSKQIVLQTLQPASTWLVDIASAHRVTEMPGLTEPWQCVPVIDESGRVTLVTDTRRIECHVAQATSPLWTYRGGMSFAHVDPVTWTSRRQLLLTVDGTTLVEISRDTGRVVWSAGLADLPLTDPARQVIATGNTAFVASRGLLRSISLKNGERRWEQFLGQGGEQWQVAACGPLIAAWPVFSRESSAKSVVWCDADSGRVVQRLNLPLETRSLAVVGDERGATVLTDLNVVALRSAEAPTAGQIAGAKSR